MNTFEDRLRAALREQENELARATLARLGVARRAALAAPAPSWWRLHAPALGGAVLAAAVAVAVLLPMPQEILHRPDTDASGQLVEDPEFYQDLDFYLWLADSEMSEHG